MKKSFLLAVLLCSLWTITCYAQSTSISGGTTWLSMSQNADGSWGASSDLNIVYSDEVLNALRSVGTETNYSTGISWLTTQDVSSTDELSRKITASANAGMDTSTFTSTLLGYRNSDGGWSYKKSPASDSLDTALALQALKAANYSNTTLIGQSLGYLTTNQNTDGGWSSSVSDPSNTFLTSTVLRTLAAYNSLFINQNSINQASAFLLAHQNIDGGFGNSPSTVYDTATSLIALIESGQGNTQTILSGINYLTSTQSANGSWNDDPYSTALALQALAQARPNLAVSSSGITFSNSMPQSGATTTISAVISNTGYDNTSNVIVRFYLGDPSAGGTQIGTDQIRPFIALGSSAQATITASFTGTGGKTIFVVWW
jgi:large repetitive protein